MESSIVGSKGQVVIPKKIHAVFGIQKGTRVHFEARAGEIVLILRLAPRPPAVGSLRIPPQRQKPRGSTPLTPRYFEHMAGCLGTSGKATKALLEERKRERDQK
jgi:AbrB family looped-hinge helix DNA binding protein